MLTRLNPPLQGVGLSVVKHRGGPTVSVVISIAYRANMPKAQLFEIRIRGRGGGTCSGVGGGAQE